MIVACDDGGIFNCTECCWMDGDDLVQFRVSRLTDEGVEALTKPFLEQTTSPNRMEALSVAGCSLLTDEVGA